MTACDRLNQPVIRRPRNSAARGGNSYVGGVGEHRSSVAVGSRSHASVLSCRQSLRVALKELAVTQSRSLGPPSARGMGSMAATPTAPAVLGTAALGGDAEVDRIFGGRFLPDYAKKGLLGRGACGAVWLANSLRHGGTVAVKQVAKTTGQKAGADLRSAGKEIRVGQMLFGTGGVPRISASQHPGIRHITKLIDAVETKSDIFLVMEYGGTVLSKALFEVKGEFVARGSFQPRERIYRVHHLPFYEAMKHDQRILKRFLRQAFLAIKTLSDLGVVHSDLKPDNLLLTCVDGQELQMELRLCDFGSSFLLDRPENLVVATPEYMPPEALMACLAHAAGQSEATTAMQQKSLAWSFDVWSLGAIMLELVYGVPHWLSYKCRVNRQDGGRDQSVLGLFAVPGRDHERILQRQQDLVLEGGLEKVLQNAPGVVLEPEGFGLLKAMLSWDPEDRISPEQALAHPYLNFS